MFRGPEDFDPRNHRSLLIPGYERESLVDLNQEDVAILNPLMLEAEEFFDEALDQFCWRYIALRTGKGAARANLVAGVARSDEQLQVLEAENRGPRPAEPI